MNLFARFVREENGQDLIEYALLASMISIAAIGVLPGVGTAVTNVFTAVTTALAPAA
jgi:pilus assembly protein Flp/PilA